MLLIDYLTLLVDLTTLLLIQELEQIQAEDKRHTDSLHEKKVSCIIQHTIIISYG